MWTAAAYPRVLRARASGGGSFDATSAGVHFSVGEGIEHLAIADAGSLIRLDIVAGSVRGGSVQLTFELPHDQRLRDQLDAVRSFDAWLSGRRNFAPRDARLRRAVAALRAHDAQEAGASLRQIGAELLGARDWPGPGECFKSQARRLVAVGAGLVAAGPLPILAG